MYDPVLAALESLVVGEPQTAGGLQVFGVRYAVIPEPLPYLLLDEALQKGLLRIEEINESGQVPKLRAVNEADVAVFVLVGDQLIGAKQNRVVNTSILLKPKSAEIIPVSCVEQGRWAYRSHTFYSKGTAGHYSLRRAMQNYVTERLMMRGQFESDQASVWQEVRRKLEQLKSFSASEALEQAYEDYQYTLDELIKKHPVPEDSVGAVFAFNGEVAGLEVFDNAETLRKLWPKLLRSYGLDALTARCHQEISTTEVVDWIQNHGDLEFHAYKPPGMGEDIRFSNEYMTGSALVADGRVIHLSIFPQRKFKREMEVEEALVF
ncbi:MAG: hypothetical protein NZM31_10125 [Gemmatales bacterium]|nr:hypothetical protein [Gemmatales bacterium]MDW8387352.1 DUF6569 family protein [Gemmatales bacterium]